MPWIQFSLESIYDYVDQIVVVDGPFKGFPHNSLSSTDGTLDFLRQFEKVTVKRIEQPLRQEEKRNLYFDGGADWYFIIDGDEICFGDVKGGFDFVREHSPELFTCLTITTFEKTGIQRRIRFYSERVSPHYLIGHAVVCDKHNNPINAPTTSPDHVPYFFVANCESLRDYKRKEVMHRYRASPHWR